MSNTSLRFYLLIAEMRGFVEDFGDGFFYRSGLRFLLKEGSELDCLFRKRFKQNQPHTISTLAFALVVSE
ncbi:hypothetical protein ACP3V3_04635 [Vibrio sp. PNB22_3_1]